MIRRKERDYVFGKKMHVWSKGDPLRRSKNTSPRTLASHIPESLHPSPMSWWKLDLPAPRHLQPFEVSFSESFVKQMGGFDRENFRKAKEFDQGWNWIPWPGVHYLASLLDTDDAADDSYESFSDSSSNIEQWLSNKAILRPEWIHAHWWRSGKHEAVVSGGHMLQFSLNTDLIAWVVRVTIPLPMTPFSRHNDNRLEGSLEFGRDLSRKLSEGLKLKIRHGITRQVCSIELSALRANLPRPCHVRTVLTFLTL